MRARAVLLAGVVAMSATVVLMAPAEATDVLCFGEPVTIMGTDGDDDLGGTAGVHDVIYGGAGNDRLEQYWADTATDEPDLMCGGPGNDWLRGGHGGDKLRGGTGGDVVLGMRGDDIMRGGPGNDRLGYGSYSDASGNDVDLYYGGRGNDYIVLDWGPDKAYGARGDDVLHDQECGYLTLRGGAGNDTFASYFSSYTGRELCNDEDRIIGGDGADTAVVNPEDLVSTVEDLIRVVIVDTTMTATSPIEAQVRAGESTTLSGFLEVPGGTGTRSLWLTYRPDSKAEWDSHWDWDPDYITTDPATDGIFPFSESVTVNRSGTWGVSGFGDQEPGLIENASGVLYHVTAKSWVTGWPQQGATKNAGTKVSKTVTVAPAYQRPVILQKRSCMFCQWQNVQRWKAPKGASGDLTVHWRVAKSVTQWRVLLPETKSGTEAVTDAWTIKGR